MLRILSKSFEAKIVLPKNYAKILYDEKMSKIISIFINIFSKKYPTNTKKLIENRCMYTDPDSGYS